MNKIALLTSLTVTMTALMTGCSNSDVSPFTSGTASSTTNIIYANNFSIGVDPVNPEVIVTDTTVTPTTVTAFGGVEVTVTATAGDINNAFVSAGTVYFRTEYGLLSAPSCTIDATGSCSITWYSILNFADLIGTENTITAYTYGQEGFTDTNGNGTFDDGETFFDMPEPYVDSDESGGYTAGDKIIDLDSNGIHTIADTQYNGSACTHSTSCSGITISPIFATISFDITVTK